MEVPLGRHLFLAHRACADDIDERLRAIGASLWMWLLLRHAIQADGPSQRELAELMRIEAPTLVRHLDKLEEQGLVERRRDESDRRVIRVYPTTAGRKRFEQFHAVVSQADAELRDALGGRDAAALTRVLTKIEGYYGVAPIAAVYAGGNGSQPAESKPAKTHAGGTT